MDFITLINLHTRERCAFPSQQPVVAALGNFDGVHRAHRMLLSSAVQLAKNLSGPGKEVLSAAWCFQVPSGDFLSVEPPRHLTTVEEKLSLFAAVGIDFVFLVNFPSVRDMAPEEFIDQLLVQQCCVVGVVCGFNFRFGQGGRGTSSLLEKSFGERSIIVPKCTVSPSDDTVISSSEIRARLEKGDIEGAETLLGYPYFLRATVVQGKQLGRTLGLPTINQCFSERKLIPLRGIYASLCILDGKIVLGVSNVGIRPTVEGNGLVNCETHLIGIDENLYGRELTVFLIHRLRDEQRFDSVLALQNAIQGDVETMKQYFDSERGIAAINLLKEWNEIHF